MKLSVAKKRYKGDWLAFHFAKKGGEEGRVLFHDKDRHLLHKKLASHKTKSTGVYITFAGPMLPDPKEYAVILITS